MQFHDVVTCCFCKLLIFVIQFFRFTIESFKIRKLHRNLTRCFLYALKVSNQHTELSAPVTDVVSSDHFMA
ncbi:Uncharacterised protein [Vibrio cholerae]|nr:Uncharacterised protein [Vibrio cholerae]CSD38174.1 Uncharacterised protein [Vibrio cholerae]CSI62762.1 Uncharacterised protein [Vibrio cholerae]